ncbi:cytochrome c oxidase assembly factor 7 [Brachionichthys hirsutus]|uniref:cytochrome c oxidase assembly factor 7 n=1 Tax=Brachionichthys hirsutus TaxID=412623 RepID=UPI0036048167
MAGLINFEDEDEVKQFLENLGIEYSFQCHSENDPEGCQRLAEYLEGVRKDCESAARVFKQNCETNGHGDSCYKLGSYHIAGKGGVPQCLKTASSYFMRSCTAGGKRSMDACHNVGLLAHDGRVTGGTPDPVAARQYYEKACAGGFAASCFNLSALFIKGSGLPKDMTQALKYANRACELGHAWGCANASRMYKLGEGTEKDEKKAEELKKRALQLRGAEMERQLKFGE